MKYIYLFPLFVLFMGCSNQPDYDGNNPKEYFYKNCKDKSVAVQESANCVRSLKDLRIQRNRGFNETQ